MVDQVELHPFFAQNGALETMKEFSVARRRGSPWQRKTWHLHPPHPNCNRPKVWQNRRPGGLRWNTQRGVIVIPQVHPSGADGGEPEHMGFLSLSDDDMSAIAALDLGHSEIIDHSLAETAKFLNGWKIHE